MADNERIQIEGTYLGRTAKAIRIEYEAESIWLPESQIEYWPGDPGHREIVNIELPMWLAESKGIY